MTNSDLEKTVDEAISSMERAMAEIDRQRKENRALRDALYHFVLPYVFASDPIGDSDLDDEQPRSVSVTLGNCREAAALLQVHKTPDGGVIVR